ncbi:MAG TPA: LysR substrate-binding domain-containing protein, partial [Terriglobales bacterium]|nr:LysR substrate-binding domain-containing protein [Terriglobales bacterium]
EDWFHAAGCSPIVAAETGAIEVMLQLIATGIGVAILPRSIARRGLAMGMHCLSLEPHDSPRRVVAAVRRRSGRNAELVDVLLPILEEYARDASRPAVPSNRIGRHDLED